MSEYDRNTTPWSSYDGRQTLIKDLDTRHLVNVINHCKQHDSTRSGVSYGADFINFIEGEANYRVMKNFTANEGIPHQQEDGYWTVINLSVEEAEEYKLETDFHNRELKRTIAEKAEVRKKRRKAVSDWTGVDLDDLL